MTYFITYRSHAGGIATARIGGSDRSGAIRNAAGILNVSRDAILSAVALPRKID